MAQHPKVPLRAKIRFPRRLPSRPNVPKFLDDMAEIVKAAKNIADTPKPVKKPEPTKWDRLVKKRRGK